jgi:hypothetical protein
MHEKAEAFEKFWSGRHCPGLVFMIPFHIGCDTMLNCGGNNENDDNTSGSN